MFESIRGIAVSCTFKLEVDVNWQVCPDPSVAAEAEEKTKSHDTAANAPLISWDEGLPVKSTVTWFAWLVSPGREESNKRHDGPHERVERLKQARIGASSACFLLHLDGTAYPKEECFGGKRPMFTRNDVSDKCYRTSVPCLRSRVGELR